MTQEDNLKLARECFRKARITDELSPSSEKKYLSSIRAFLGRCNAPRWEALSNEDIENFTLQMKETGASNARIANILAALKWLITRLAREGVSFNQLRVEAIKKPKIVKKETNYLTEHELAKLLGCIQGDIQQRPTVNNLRLMALVMLLLQTGARIGEALSINKADIDRENKEISIIGKGAKPRTLFLRAETLSWIDRYLALRCDEEPALFVTQAGTDRWKQTDVGRVFRKYKVCSGIRKDFVVHTLRHTFATQYLLRGAGINVVQTAMGHSDPVTTLKYYAAAVEKAKVKAMINDRSFDFLPSAVLRYDAK